MQPPDVLAPRIIVLGQIVEISTIIWPLFFVVLPLLLGLVTGKSKLLGLLLLVVIPLIVSLQAYTESMAVFPHQNPKAFEFVAFMKLLLVLLPGFLVGLIAPVGYKKVSARA